jgi:hypothetical protein
VKTLDGAEGPPGELFRTDIEQVVLTGLNAAGNALVVETWQRQRGFWRVERA